MLHVVIRVSPILVTLQRCLSYQGHIETFTSLYFYVSDRYFTIDLTLHDDYRSLILTCHCLQSTITSS